jgi:hypothetical protein
VKTNDMADITCENLAPLYYSAMRRNPCYTSPNGTLASCMCLNKMFLQGANLSVEILAKSIPADAGLRAGMRKDEEHRQKNNGVKDGPYRFRNY